MDFLQVAGELYPQRAAGVEPEKIPWADPNYRWQVKYDGDRRLVYIMPDRNINTSKSKSASTGSPVEKTDNVPHIRDLDIPSLNYTILDGEFVHVRGFKDGVRKIMGCLPDKAIQRQEEWGWIEFRVFDIIALKGNFLHDEEFDVRDEILKATYEAYLKDIPFIQLAEDVEGTPEELQEKLTEIINNGGEGMVAKHRKSKYRLSTEKCMSPLKNAWIKVKREFNGDFIIMGFDEPTRLYTGDHLETHKYWQSDDNSMMELNGTKEVSEYSRTMGEGLDPVTEFYYKGWIGSIKFGEYENGVLVERGAVTGITKELRAQLSANPESYIGKVIEIDAMERIKDTKALRQPVFKRFRDDKLPEDCTYESQKG